TFRGWRQYSLGLGAGARHPSHFKEYILFHLLKNNSPILLFLNRVISRLANEFEDAKFELIRLKNINNQYKEVAIYVQN
ncbi:MAG: hypothetical protein ABF649_19315, partial [Bacillus sp. (in: firmicutes)]